MTDERAVGPSLSDVRRTGPHPDSGGPRGPRERGAAAAGTTALLDGLRALVALRGGTLIYALAPRVRRGDADR